nr:unnamed protein product [Callosobruchus chinensis]
MESRLYGLITKDLRALAYALTGCLSKHPELSKSKLESNSAARAAGFNKQAAEKCFNFFGNVYDEQKLSPDRIYKCDETGVSVLLKMKSKIITRKGRKQWSIYATNDGIPKKENGPTANAEGYPWSLSDSELLLGWFREFARFSGATVDRPVLLLDGHRTHTQNIDVINEVRSSAGIVENYQDLNKGLKENLNGPFYFKYIKHTTLLFLQG